MRGLKGSKGEKVRGVGERGQQGTGVLVLWYLWVPGVGGHSSLPSGSSGWGHAWAAAGASPSILGFVAQPHTMTPSGASARASAVSAPQNVPLVQGEDGFPGFKGDMGPKGDRVSGIPTWGSSSSGLCGVAAGAVKPREVLLAGCRMQGGGMEPGGTHTALSVGTAGTRGSSPVPPISVHPAPLHYHSRVTRVRWAPAVRTAPRG